MPHVLVRQLYFARSEFQRLFAGVPEEDGVIRILPMNSLSWIVGHLASQEQSYWLYLAQGPETVVCPELGELVGYGKPATTPPMADMWDAWQEITVAADSYLATVTDESLAGHFERDGEPMDENIGTLILRNIYHYWFHTGEAHAIRQQLGHQNIPDFVGEIADASYRLE